MNAYLLSKGDDKYLDVWRKTADKIRRRRPRRWTASCPRRTMFGDQGLYGFKPGKYNFNFLEIYHLSMKPSDRARCEDTDWYDFLEGKNPGYPVKALRAGPGAHPQADGDRATTTPPRPTCGWRIRRWTTIPPP